MVHDAQQFDEHGKSINYLPWERHYLLQKNLSYFELEKDITKPNCCCNAKTYVRNNGLSLRV